MVNFESDYFAIFSEVQAKLYSNCKVQYLLEMLWQRAKLYQGRSLCSTMVSKAGDFKIKYSGDKPIAIIPSAGSIPPKSVQLIKVGFLSIITDI